MAINRIVAGGKSNSTSPFKGVSYNKQRKKFMVQIKRRYIGAFSNELDAAKAYDEEAIKVFGEFAYLNLSPQKPLPPKSLYREHNVIHINGDICTMELYNKKGLINGYTIFNLKHLKLIRQYKWSISHGYVATNVKNKFISFHRLILNSPPRVDTDHKDRNPLNNLDDNIRQCNKFQNMANKGLQKNNTTKYKGVCKSGKKWYAEIRQCYKSTYLGVFNSPESAAMAYDEKAKELFGEFAYLNFPERKYEEREL